jgi:hypothetical protein
MSVIEEDSDQAVTPIPSLCTVWKKDHPCSGEVKADGQFMRFQRCGVSYGAAPSTPKAREPVFQVPILAFLQNQWFKNPARMEQLLNTRYAGRREDFVRTFLFWSCLTGRRLQEAFGEQLCGEIIWEEASPRIAGKSDGVFPADPQHMAAAIAKHQPQIILTFGAIAGAGMACIGSPDNCYFIHGPHPAARGSNVLRDLRRMAENLKHSIVRIQESNNSGSGREPLTINSAQETA